MNWLKGKISSEIQCFCTFYMVKTEYEGDSDSDKKTNTLNLAL